MSFSERPFSLAGSQDSGFTVLVIDRPPVSGRRVPAVFRRASLSATSRAREADARSRASVASPGSVRQEARRSRLSSELWRADRESGLQPSRRSCPLATPLLFSLRYLLLDETTVSSFVKRWSRDASLDTLVKLVFHTLHGSVDAPPDAGWGPSHSVEPPRARVASFAVARCGAAQTVRLSPARHARAVRRLPVARSGDPAGRRGRDPDSSPADRERGPGRRATSVPRAA